MLTYYIGIGGDDEDAVEFQWNPSYMPGYDNQYVMYPNYNIGMNTYYPQNDGMFNGFNNDINKQF